MPVIFLDVMHSGSKDRKALTVWLVKQPVQVPQKSESTGQISLQRIAQLVSLIRWKAIYSVDSAIYLMNDWVLRNIACVASVSVRFWSKERPRNGILGFGCARNETRAKQWKWGEGEGSFLPFFPTPLRSFTCTIFRAVFDSRSSFFAPNISELKQQRFWATHVNRK